MNPRHFLKSTATGTIALNAFPHHLFASETKKDATDRVKLGPRNVEVSRLAQGTSTGGVGGSSNQTRKLGMRGLADLFIAGYDNGLMLWDSADQYGTHPYIHEALKKAPREKVAILTKTHASNEKEMRADLDHFRRTHGTSCHTLGALKAAASSPWVEVDLARFNAAQVLMDSTPAEVYPALGQMKASGKGVIGMKILGAGKLRGKPDECLQFTLAHNHIDCFTAASVRG
ncbi:MAG: aldo/keto reductase [Bryobacteraceae bacterium]